MSRVGNPPHIYYTITELSFVKDIKILKNLNVKVIGYVCEGKAYEIDLGSQIFERSNKWIQLDLTHITYHIPEMKPHIIFGILYSLNESLALCVKSVNHFDGNYKQLILYHNQLLAVRKKSMYFKDLEMQENMKGQLVNVLKD